MNNDITLVGCEKLPVKKSIRGKRNNRSGVLAGSEGQIKKSRYNDASSSIEKAFNGSVERVMGCINKDREIIING